MELYFSADGVRAALVFVLAIGQVVMAYWPELRKWPETTPSRSAKLQNPLVPIDWAFAIWGLIFASIIAFGLWQVLPGNLQDPLLRQIGWLAIVLFAGNIAWEAWVPKRGLDWVSVAIIWAELALLLTILAAIANEAPTGLSFWFVSAPFQIFTGWVSAAVFVNTASTLRRSGVHIGTRLALAVVLMAGILGSVVAFTTGSWIYAGAVAWALFGLVVANTRRTTNPPVALLSGSLAMFVLAVTAIA
jgi:hypothetical protein